MRKVSSTIKQVLSMPKEEFEKYINQWEASFIEENGAAVKTELAEAVSSAGQPNFDKVLFDERTKGFVRIQYAKKGTDYIYHIFFKKEPPADAHYIMNRIYESVAKLLPREPQKIVSPPQQVNDFAEPFYIECYTLLVKDITKFSGSRRIMEEIFVNDLLNGLNFFAIPEENNAASDV